MKDLFWGSWGLNQQLLGLLIKMRERERIKVEKGREKWGREKIDVEKGGGRERQKDR